MYAGKIAGSNLSREEALGSYLLYFIPQISFPLPVLTLSEQQCKNIQSPALLAVLPKLHFNRHTARSIIHGPELYGGLNLPTVYFLQCNGQLQLLVSHLCTQDKTANLILIFMSTLQLLVGSATLFFNLTFPKYAKWIEQSLLTFIWQCVSRVKFSLRIKQAWTPSLQRENDIMIIDHFISLNYKPKDLQSLNRCRLYLQALTLADLVSADGRTMIPETVNGYRLVDRRSTLKWPVQQRPSPQAWKLWSSALHYLHRGGKLLLPVGGWVSPSHQSWSWYMDQSRSVLFHNPMGIEWFRAEPTQQTSGRTTRSAHRTRFLRSSLQATQPPNSSKLLPASLPGNPTSADELIPIPSETPLPRTSHQLCPAPYLTICGLTHSTNVSWVP